MAKPLPDFDLHGLIGTVSEITAHEGSPGYTLTLDLADGRQTLRLRCDGPPEQVMGLLGVTIGLMPERLDTPAQQPEA